LRQSAPETEERWS